MSESDLSTEHTCCAELAASQARCRELETKLDIVGQDFSANRLYQGQLERRNADLQATLAAREDSYAEVERKLRDMCMAHGNLLIEHHDVKKERDAAVQEAGRFREVLACAERYHDEKR